MSTSDEIHYAVGMISAQVWFASASPPEWLGTTCGWLWLAFAVSIYLFREHKERAK